MDDPAPTATVTTASRSRGRSGLPSIIQGGMGVAVSDWRLAQAVSRAGELGVVSATAIEVVMARRLQDGDPGGHVRRALAHFPVPEIAGRIVSAYFVQGGKPAGTPYRATPMFSVRPARLLQELTVAAAFVEVFLAKEGHDGQVGVNFLRKIEAPLPFGLYGAMVAGVDVVLVGAGNPHEVPALLDALARGADVELSLRVQKSPADATVHCSPRAIFGTVPPEVRRPRFLAIVASNDLAEGLAASAATRPDGFVVEGPPAGGHNAPPRGPRRLDDRGQPVYGERDVVDLSALRALGVPFWLAGRYGTPEGLRAALAQGAAGVQVGTAFAFCGESGMAAPLRQAVTDRIRRGPVDVRTDGRASPTGFPFKVVEVEGTLSDDRVVGERARICDLGVLRVPYVRDNGSLGYRCPAEPVRSYTEVKGGRAANTEGRLCLCNGLLATAGYAQTRADGRAEPALVTAGNDLGPVADLLATLPPGRTSYSAGDVIAYLRGAG